MKLDIGTSTRLTNMCEIDSGGPICDRRSLSLCSAAMPVKKQPGESKRISLKNSDMWTISHLVHRICRAATSYQCRKSILDCSSRTNIEMSFFLDHTYVIIQLAWCDEVRQEINNHGFWSTAVHTERQRS